MITLYLVILLIQLIFFKRRPGVLACGLIGYCGGKPADPWKLRLLFLYNLKRGEHATGICIDKAVYKTVAPASKFLAEHFELFDIIESAKDFTIIGHDRQASSGSKDKLELAHPHGIEMNGELKLILAHNGTIQNIHALSEKYKIKHEYNEHSDSLTLAKIMTSVGDVNALEVLKEYTGTASLLFLSPKYKNTLFIHRDPERDLYYYQESENSIYISSMEESLYAIGGNKDNVFEFKGFTIYKCVKGKLVKTWDTSVRQPAITTYERPLRPVTNTSFHKNRSMFANNDLNPKETKIPNGFVCKDASYYLNGHLYTGYMYIHPLLNEYCRNEMEGFTKLWFVHGVLMRSKENYDKLLEKGCEGNIFDATKYAKNIYLADISEHSMFPVKSPLDIAQGMLFFAVEFHEQRYGKGGKLEFMPYLSNKVYRINRNGIQVGEPETVVQAPVTERKVVTKTLGETIRQVCSSQPFEEIATLYTSVRLEAKLAETDTNYTSFCEEFVKILEDDGVVNRNDTMEILSALEEGNVKVTFDSLNTLLQLYNSFLRTGELSIETEIEELRNKSRFLSTEQFKRDVDQLTYGNLEDFAADYCETDKDEDTTPFLQAVTLELNRIGLITDEETMQIYKMSPGTAYSVLCRKYDIYASVKPETCCTTETFTDVLAKKYMEAERLGSIKTTKISSDELAILEKLRGEIADMLQETHAINVAHLRDKYGITLDLIQEEYAGNETR